MWLKIKNRYEELITSKSKRGIQSLTMVAGVIMAFIAIGGLADLTILQSKFSVVSSQTGYISRVVSDQGGISYSEISNYHGKYVTSGELYQNVKAAMNHSGVSDEHWEVHIDGKKLTPSTHTRLFDYGEKIPIEVKIDYRWSFSSNFLPGQMKNSRTSKTETLSTYRVRDGGYSED